MNFAAFKNLTPEQARGLLNEFLDEESRLGETTFKIASEDGIVCDYSIQSLPEFLRWVFKHLRTVQKGPDPSVSEWIRSTDSYKSGLFDFVDESKNLLVRASYYLGECFIRTYPCLQWSIGNSEFAYANMPVVTGFQHEVELAPLMVLENTCRRIIKKPSRISDIDTMVAKWCENVPS